MAYWIRVLMAVDMDGLLDQGADVEWAGLFLFTSLRRPDPRFYIY